jgi:hypothetical protein
MRDERREEACGVQGWDAKLRVIDVITRFDSLDIGIDSLDRDALGTRCHRWRASSFFESIKQLPCPFSRKSGGTAILRAPPDFDDQECLIEVIASPTTGHPPTHGVLRESAGSCGDAQDP